MRIRRHAHPSGQRALELTDEAVHLLRTAPAPAAAAYCVGTVPFVLGLLYFWSEMSRDAFAARRCVTASLVMAVLFVWMKCWHSVFAAHLNAAVTGNPAPRWSPGRALRMAVLQTAVQPFGLLAIPAALLLMIPFYSVHAFFQNFTLIADGVSMDIRAAARRAWRQALAWPVQNHLLLWLFSPWVLAVGMLAAFGSTWMILSTMPEVHEVEGVLWFGLALIIMFQVILPFAPFGCVVAGNIAVALVTLPSLLHILFGVESVFTLSGIHGVLNTTFLLTVYSLSYFCLDPLVKAAHVLRCHYGESRHTGEDLRSELRAMAEAPRRNGARVAGMLLLLFLCLAPARAETAAAEPPAAEAGAVDARELDEAITEVISRPDYAWRLPRERAERVDSQTWHAFWEGAFKTVEKLAVKLARFLKVIERWLDRLFPDRDESAADAFGWQTPVQILLYVLTAVALSALAIFLYRLFTRKQRGGPVLTAAAVTPADILRDAVEPDRLPADEWMALARDFLEKGEMRLAIRAMFLASLAHLAFRGHVTLARYKSNHDYLADLDRRVHDRPELLGAFLNNVRTLEEVWYGTHEATREKAERFTRNQELILGH